MTTIDVQVAADANDGRGQSPGYFFGNSCYWGYYYSNDMMAFFRFTGITIPAGATITAAYLSFRARSYYTAICANQISADDQASPAAPTTWSDLSGRTRTTAKVSWTPAAWSAGTWYNTSSITTIIQELLASYSYSSGVMQFLIEKGISSQYYLKCDDYSDGASYAAKLHIEYTSGSAIPVMMSQYRRRVA